MVGGLIQLLRDGLHRNRTELASLTGPARFTVSSRIDTLMELGLVSPIGEAVSARSRPSAQFAQASAGKVVFGVSECFATGRDAAKVGP